MFHLNGHIAAFALQDPTVWVQRGGVSVFKGPSSGLFAEVVSWQSPQQGWKGHSNQVLFLGAWEERAFVAPEP